MHVEPFFAYESSVPQHRNGKYLRERTPIGHLIINYRITFVLPFEQIPVRLEPDEVQAAIWMPQEELERTMSRLDPTRDVTGFDCKGKPLSFKLGEFFPYFPNENLQGMGKSSVFALRY